jgi:hypothetical protein
VLVSVDVEAAPGSRNELADAARRATRDAVYVLLALFAMVFAYIVIRGGFDHDSIGFDFEGTLWDPGRAILDGESPYPAPTVADLQVGNPAIYPPLLMVLVSPLTVLPWALGLAVWTGVLVAALVGSLYVLGIRDLRCYAFALLSAPAIGSFVLGNATLILLPLVALGWRWRERWLRTGVLVGVAVAAKFFLWPLLLWLVGARRYRAASVAVGATVLGLLVPWALIGFDGLPDYPDMLRVATDLYAVHSYSVATILHVLGLGAQSASRFTLAAGLAVAVVALVAGRRGRESTSLSLAVLAALIGSPILWPYYLVFLLVPLAISRPRFSGLWAMLPLLWLVPLLPRERLTSADFSDGGVACCRPDDVPSAIWEFNHSPPRVWPALGFVLFAVAFVLLTLRRPGRRLAAP